MSRLKKIGNIFLILLGIVLIAGGWFVYKIESPAFQTEVSQKVFKYLSKKVNAEMSIGHVRIKFFHSVLLDDVLIRDQNRDTLIGAKKIEVQLGLLSFFQSKYAIDGIYLDDAHVYLHRPQNDTNWNYQFLADAFSSKNPSTKKSKLQLELGKVHLTNTHFVMLDEPNTIELNFRVPALNIDVNKLDLDQPRFDLKKLVLDHADLRITKTLITEIDTSTFPQPDTDVVHINSKPIQLFVSDFQLVDSKFTYNDLNEPVSTGEFDGVHEDFTHLNFHFTNGSLVLDTIKAHIDNISFQEKSGFVVNHLEGDARVTPKEAKAENLKLVTPNSSLQDFFSFTYINFHSFLSFNEMVTITTELKQANVSMKDVKYFIPAAEGINEKLLADGTISGTLDNLKARNLKLQTGTVTRFAGNVDLKGLPDINETYINLKVNNLASNAGDIEKWIPGTKLPAEVSRLGVISFSGTYTGFINDFVAYGTFNTQLGQVTSDLDMKFRNGASAAEYSGNLAASDFNLGRLIEQDSTLGNISFAMNIKGTGLDVNTMDAKMSGTVSAFKVLDYNYRNADIVGTLKSKVFIGTVNMNDENIKLAFGGVVDMNTELPAYNFSATVDSANLQALGFSSDPMLLSLKTDMNMNGKNIDDFIGSAEAKNIVFFNSKERWKLDSIRLVIDEKSGEKGRNLLLTSPIAGARFDGSFAITKLPGAVMSLIDHYFPSLPGDYSSADASQDFDFKIQTEDVSGFEKFFMKNVSGIDSAKIEGHFNSATHTISFSGSVPQLSYGNFRFGEVYLNAKSVNDSLNLAAGSHLLHISDSILIVDPVLTSVLYNDVIALRVKGSSPNQMNHMNVVAEITGDTGQVRLHVLPSDMVLNGRAWKISPANLVTYSDERLVFHDFSLNSEDRSLTVKNVNLRVRATNLEFGFQNIPIADFHEFITWNDVQLAGNLNGTLQVLNVFNSPRFISGITVNNFSANETKIETVTAGINYTPEDDRMNVQLQLTDPQYDVHAEGTFFPKRVTDELNVEFDIRRVNLELLQSVLFEGMISNTQGSASGKLTLTGTPTEPLLTGEMQVTTLSSKVNYLQTTYHCSNATVLFKEGQIDLGKLTLFDELNNEAEAKGEIFHNHLSDWSMNVAITTNKFLALKTTQKDDSTFYGTAIASGIIQFLGPVEQMEIRASVTSLKGTSMSIPVSDAASVSSTSFIQYINKKHGAVQTQNGYERVSGLIMNINMDITPAAVIQIIFDQQTGDIIRGSGSGNIRMEIDTKGDFNMFGVFTIESGNYLFTQFNFFNKYFTIERGGTVVWDGDPYEATINISAIYSTKTSLIELVPPESVLSDEDRRDLQKRYAVDLYLKLTGSLFSPDISFDIQLPDISNVGSAASVELLRLKSDQNELNKQAFGLLTLGHFLPTSGVGGQSIRTEGINSLSGFITSQINSLASQVRSDVDFSLNYQAYEASINSADPNNTVQRNELQVAVTKRFFNDRLAVDVGGNFDFGAANQNTQSASSIAGDFSLEYKITPDGRVSGKVFSTSDYDVVDERNKTKNGIGLKYTRNFDTLKELFHDPKKQKIRDEKKKAKEQKKSASQSQQSTSEK